jgi:uncharacterized cupredoxin-like copper-binding protein
MPRRLGQTIVVVLVLALGPPVAGAQAGDAPPKPHPAVAAADWRETTEIVLELGDHRYEPNEITLRLGKPYKIVLRNVGNTSHDMVGGSFFDDEVIALRMVSSKAGRVTAQEVTSIYVRSKHDTEVWLVPIREGQYTFYCSLPQHRESGMEGTIKVKR